MSLNSLLILGCGDVGEKLALACLADGLKVTGTTRSRARADELRRLGIDAVVVESPEQLPRMINGVDSIDS